MLKRILPNDGKVNLIDFLLVAVAAMTAVYAGGQAVVLNLVSILGVCGVALGLGMSYLFRRLLDGSKLLTFDWVPYMIVMLCCVFFIRDLNTAFPEETFPRELLPSSWLFWMLTLGSFFLWSDRTLLFHAIPALAMFGFVACYDTFRPVIFFFFVYLICFATLFARAHARDMQQRAIQSGFFSDDPAAIEQPERQILALKEGPWRWAAGPEWALWSAMGIVLLSLLGAPVIRMTVKPISGVVRLANPIASRAIQNAVTGSSGANPPSTRVGNGPISLRETPVFDVQMSEDSPFSTLPLRTGVYDRFKDRSWDFVWDNSSEYLDEHGVYVAKGYDIVMKLDDPAKEFVVVTSLRPTQEVPQRGMEPVIVSAEPKNGLSDRSDVVVLRAASSYTGAQVGYTMPRRSNPKANAPKIIGGNLKAALDTSNFKQSVADQARKIAGSKGSDAEKAERIRSYISQTIVYNTKAKACPADKDPAEWVLFESKEGYCDLYATSMVQMARVIGIPARYAVGYLPNSNNRSNNGHWILQEADRHAWAELFFAGQGWVVFDATDGAAEIPGGERSPARGNGNGLPIIPMLLGALAIIAAVGIGAYSWTKVEIKKTDVVKKERDSLVLDFVAVLWKHSGRRRQLGETLNEYAAVSAERIETDSPTLKGELIAFATELTNTMYSPEGSTPEEIAALKVQMSGIRAALKVKKKPTPKVSVN